jgi:Tol biopolymer transport system component
VYLSVDDGAASHLWRQRFPNGQPEPITSSPASDEIGVAVDPDGRSLITSVGRRSSTLWYRDASGDRQLTSEGFAWAPELSRDNRRVFYLVQRGSSPQTRLAVLDLDTSRAETLFPDVVVDQFNVSPDGGTVVYSTPSARRSDVWVAPVDRSAAPRRLVENADSAYFIDDTAIVFRAIGDQANFADTIRVDGSQRRRVRPEPMVGSPGASPDGRWVVVHRGSGERTDIHGTTESVALSLDGQSTQPICFGPCRTVWTTTGSHLFVMFFQQNRTLSVPLPKGRMFPDAPAGQQDPIDAWEQLPGARWLPVGLFAPGPDGDTYVFTKREELRNLFRIPIR